MDRKKVLEDLRKEVESKRSKIEDIDIQIQEARDNLDIYNRYRDKIQEEVDQIEDTLELMEM